MNYELFIGTPQNNIRFDIFEINSDCDFVAYVHINSDYIHVINYRYCAYQEPLLDFYEQLKACYATLQGVAEFDPFFDDGLRFKIEMGACGYVEVSGDIYHATSKANTVHFEFEMDQMYLKETLSQLKRIVDRMASEHQKAKDNYPEDDDDEDQEVN